MDKKSKVLVLIALLTLVASVYVTYRKTIVEKDFTVVQELQN